MKQNAISRLLDEIGRIGRLVKALRQTIETEAVASNPETMRKISASERDIAAGRVEKIRTLADIQ